MITLVLLGGNSQRFLAVGHTLPKCLLPMPDYSTMLEWVLRPLPLARVVFAGRAAHKQVLEDGIYSAYPAMTHTRRIQMVWREGEAHGPLYGVLDACEHLESEESLLITYCDVIMRFPAEQAVNYWRTLKAESGAITFASSDPRYGYWDGKQVVEKKVVSHWAVSGLFYFAHASEAVERAEAVAHEGAGIVHMLNEKSAMYPVLTNQILDLGTPEAYNAFMAEGIRA